MRASLKALESYGAVKIGSVVNDANGVQLIQMLFDGLLESLSVAKGHLMHNEKIEKSKALTRAGRIVIGLQGALDLERGGELARNLFELYSYVTRRVLHANLHNDVEAINEVHGLMSEIRSAWQTMPALVPPNRADQTRGAIN
jgi:flagellar protein FliS